MFSTNEESLLKMNNQPKFREEVSIAPESGKLKKNSSITSSHIDASAGIKPGFIGNSQMTVLSKPLSRNLSSERDPLQNIIDNIEQVKSKNGSPKMKPLKMVQYSIF